MNNLSRLLVSALLLLSIELSAQPAEIVIESGNTLSYTEDNRGNRVVDFSFCGYRNSEQAIPSPPNAIFVPWQSGDNSQRIQRAIDYVSTLPIDKSGFRGAILLVRGEFELIKALRIEASGVVLRGSG